MYIKTIVIVVLTTIFMTTATFGQEHTESHSIKIKYSKTFKQENYSEICEIISSVYSEFDCSTNENPTMEIDKEDEYLKISIKRKKRIQMVFRTTNPENVNIEKLHKLEKWLDWY